MAKEEFKKFVSNNPHLIKYIKNNEMTWQSFYEMYDMYGENEEIWKPYLKEEKVTNKGSIDFMSYLKSIDLDALQESINSIQRVLGVVSDLSSSNKTSNPEYETKPLYQHLDD